MTEDRDEFVRAGEEKYVNTNKEELKQITLRVIIENLPTMKN